MSDRSPSMATVIRSAIDKRLSDVHTTLPARIVRYDAAKQIADCEPLIMAAYTDEFGARQVSKLPVVTNVPIIFPGGGGFRITFPIKVGDVMKLEFSEASIDVWMNSDGSKPVDPGVDHRFNLTDGILTPGLHPIGKPWTGVSTENMTAGKDGGTLVYFKGDVISFGSESAADALALASKVKAELDALVARVNVLTGRYIAHTHAAAAAVGTATPPAEVLLSPAPVPPGYLTGPIPSLPAVSDVGSSIVKTQS